MSTHRRFNALATMLLAAGCAAVPAQPSPAAPAVAPTAQTCAGDGSGFLRARLRGALSLDLAWRDAEMHCEGGMRPDGRGLRISIAGPQRGQGRRLRFVFGIADVPAGATVRARPTNLTVIFEGEQRIFATRGDDKCMVDELRQERIGMPGPDAQRWRVAVRGFCIGPATAVPQGGRIVVTSFDFAAPVDFKPLGASAP
jgi:hypothetical protein